MFPFKNVIILIGKPLKGSKNTIDVMAEYFGCLKIQINGQINMNWGLSQSIILVLSFR